MRTLALFALAWPLAASAESFVEAVSVQQLTGLENTYPAWSPDGSKIVFESTRDGPDADIFLMDGDGSNLVQLTRNDLVDSTPVFTPDGRHIVWASGRDGNLDVFRMQLDGTGVVNLTRHPGTDGHPKVSRDGRLIVFNSNRSSDPATYSRGDMDREHDHEIYAMDLDGGNLRRLTELPDWDTYPELSPDGTTLLWRRVAPSGGKSASGRNSEIFSMDLATGAMKNLTAHQAFDGWPAWSPDGRRIAFASNRANPAFEAFDLYIADADGSNPVRITFGDGVDGRGSWTKPGFSPDGTRLLCTRTVGASVDIFVITLNAPGDPPLEQ